MIFLPTEESMNLINQPIKFSFNEELYFQSALTINWEIDIYPIKINFIIK